MNILRHFIIGSSIIVLLSFYIMVYHYHPKKNYSYFNYSIAAPIYLGFYNVIINLVGNHYNWSLKKRYFIFSIISWMTTITISTNLNSYNFNSQEWLKYYFRLLIKYLILWNLIIIFIEKNI